MEKELNLFEVAERLLINYFLPVTELSSSSSSQFLSIEFVVVVEDDELERPYNNLHFKSSHCNCFSLRISLSTCLIWFSTFC